MVFMCHCLNSYIFFEKIVNNFFYIADCIYNYSDQTVYMFIMDANHHVSLPSHDNNKETAYMHILFFFVGASCGCILLTARCVTYFVEMHTQRPEVHALSKMMFFVTFCDHLQNRSYTSMTCSSFSSIFRLSCVTA